MLEQTCSSHACTIEFFQEKFFSNKASPINNLDKLHFVRNVLIGQWLALVRIRLFKCSSYNYVLVEQEYSLRQIKVGEYFKRAVSWCFCLFLRFNQPLCWYKCLGPSDVIVTQDLPNQLKDDRDDYFYCFRLKQTIVGKNWATFRGSEWMNHIYLPTPENKTKRN